MQSFAHIIIYLALARAVIAATPEPTEATEEPPDFIVRGWAEKKARIDYMAARFNAGLTEFNKLRAIRVKKRGSIFQTKKEKAQRIRTERDRLLKLKAEWLELKNSKAIYILPLREKLTVGDVGRLEYPILIDQIIDKTQMRVTISIMYSVRGRVRRGGSAAALESRFLRARGTPGKLMSIKKIPVWLTGVSTAGVVDGAKHTLTTAVRVAGTKQYQSLAGPRTVFLLEHFDLTPYQKWATLPEAAAKKDK